MTLCLKDMLWLVFSHSSAVFLDTSPCPLLFGVVCGSLWWLNCRRWSFDFLFSLLTGNVYHCLLCFLLFNFSSHFINFLFHSFSIYGSFYYFQFIHLIAISDHMFGFSFRSLFFLIFNFFLALLLKFFFFQFYHSINFFVIFFQFDCHSFDFFLLLKLFFNSIKPFNWKILSIKLVLFLTLIFFNPFV
jgi:hypothetical protein